MNYVKFAVVLGIACSVSSLATYLYVTLRKELCSTPVDNKNTNDDYPAQLVAYQRQLQSLEISNAQLRAMVAGSQNTSRLEHLLSNENNSISSEPTVLFDDMENYHQERKKADEFVNYLSAMNDTPGADFGTDLSEKFNAEPVNDAWADGHEKKLKAIFSGEKMLKDVAPESIECKSQQCQIRIPATTIEDVNKIAESFSKALSSNAFGVNKSTMIAAPNFLLGVVDLYVTKNNDVNIYK